MAKKKTTTKKVATKKMATKVKPQEVAKNSAKNAIKKKTVKSPKPTAVEKLNKTSVARSNTTNTDDKKGALVAFSIDDVEALVASRKVEEQPEKKKKVKKLATSKKQNKPTSIKDKPQKKRVLGAASLADILGFNPTEQKRDTTLETASIPKKWLKFYKLLIDLRQHLQEEIALHTADTLKHSSREDSGDLANYGNHQADAGTDTFDRDFALSLVSSEQDALNEIEEAILRIKNGTYGICEVTGNPIKKERLTAVPFARYSLEGQEEYEKNMRRKTERTIGGIFADTSDAPKITSDDDE
ncbi:MAG: TraR/DksA C4-type zinc finger protein [Puniceicoccaceae bacterium]|nr:TraR/DksA C4-type zinc finger protein [Puniceicoccaceae bacterium]